MSAFRPLPSRPSLEFERKEAKALLRRLRAGDPEALARARARHPSIDASAPDRIRLADAQLVIARDYGFASWPRLVRYFGDVERQRFGHRSIQSHTRDFYDSVVRGLLAEHRDRRAQARYQLAAYVPRFYALRGDEIFASAVTEEEARLAVARGQGFPSWDVLLECIEQEGRRRQPQWETDPMRYAADAMRAADLEALQRVVEAHPELLDPSESDVAMGHTLVASAIHHERENGAPAMRPIMDWLAAHGLGLQQELNRQLCGHMHMTVEEVRYLLDRGADPRWVAPNGIPVLEHALIRYWNGEAVDLVAARVAPRKALWIAAGLGDVAGVRRFLDANGKPTDAARRIRPDFDAVGQPGLPAQPDPDDEEILMEAFVVAMLNGRAAVIEYMVSRGFPIDSLVWGSPVINVAVGNLMTPMVECLVRCGANLDLRGWRPTMSAREIARERLEGNPHDGACRRVAELVGLDPDAIIAERDARPAEPPRISPKMLEAIELAGDDAFRLGQSDIRPTNLVFGLIGQGLLGPMLAIPQSGADADQLRAELAARVPSLENRAQRPKLPLHPDTQAIVQAAIALATERRRDMVGGFYLLYALTQSDDAAVADLLVRLGAKPDVVRSRLESAL